jgi:hypothetical protein
VVLVLAPGLLAGPEIWPPDGRLKPNNYIPPPVCTYVQEEVDFVTPSLSPSPARR